MNDLTETPSRKRSGGGCLPLLGLILVVGFLTSVFGDDETQRTAGYDVAQRTAGYDDSDIEYQLASIDAGERLSTNDPRIDRYKLVLDRAQTHCGDSRRFLGDMAVGSTELLAEEGVLATAYELLDGVALALDGQPRQETCSETFAMLVVLMMAP